MSYTIKEMFITLQGEGVHTGRKSLFVRFAGCNLWTGRPEDRDKGKGACARWCDTDFFKGEKFETAIDVVAKMEELWPPEAGGYKYCVLTGGEPALQFDHYLGEELHKHNWEIGVETNGSIENANLVGFADHICVSPKIGAPALKENLRAADELKVVLGGQEDWSEEELLKLADVCGGRLYVQPLDPALSPDVENTFLHPRVPSKDGDAVIDVAHAISRYRTNVNRCIDWVLRHPTWRLSLQTHKTIGLR